MDKACSSCGEVKPFTAEFFAVDGARLRATCKPCRARQRRDRRNTSETPEQRDRRLAGARKYQRENREAICAKAQERRGRNKDATALYHRARYEANKETVKARTKAWREANPERKSENNRRWAAANPDAARQSALASKRKRRKQPFVRLAESIGAQVRAALVGGKSGRSWEQIVGYPRADLVRHLERQFVRGMTWANYGTEWHVDHITPVVAFRAEDPNSPAFKACWALSNLRPLWASENVRKRDRRTHLI